MNPTESARKADPQLAEALALHRAGQLREALARYNRILTRQPGNFLARYHQGLARLQLGELEVGARTLEQAVRLQPDDPQARYDLGRAWSMLGRHAKALTHFEKLVALQPELAEARFYLGLTLAQLKLPQDALSHLERAAKLMPDQAEVWHNLGGALLDLGKHEAAASAFDKAIALKPELAEAHNGLGNAFNKLKRYKEACDAYKRAIALKGDFFEAFLGWGTALREMGQRKAAIAAYEQALAIKSDEPEVLGLLGKVLKDDGRHREALQHLTRAIDLNPHLTDVRCDLGGELYLWGRYDEGEAHFRKAMTHSPDLTGTWSAFLFSEHYRPDRTAAELAALHRAFGERFEAPLRARRPHANDCDPNRRLKVGFVSGDFRRHPVGYFMLDVLEAMDPEQVLIHLYANQAAEDDFTERFKCCARVWRNVLTLDDDTLVEQIRADGVDILVDLSGHTAYERLMVFARKPAPVQATYLGYFNSTGLAAMDYIIGNAWVLPEAEEGLYTERPWRLPESHLCYTPPTPVEIGRLPALDCGSLTLGCFNNVRKINVRVLRTWARLLERLPQARLYMKYTPFGDQQTADYFRERFATAGIPEQRLILEGSSSHTEYLQCYNKVDFALDPYPYNGGTTTVDALWMGVPTLTLSGDRYVAHMSESILRNVGLHDWIAADEDDYVARAIAFASDLEGLSRLRSELRARLLTSPLCDAPRFARHLEHAFRQMWRIWCSGQDTQGSMTRCATIPAVQGGEG